MTQSDLPETLVLRPSRAKWLGAAAVCFLMLSLGIAISFVSFNLGLVLALVGGLGLIVSLSQIANGTSRLELKRDGFSETLFGKTVFHHWSAVSSFTVWGAEQGFQKDEFVGYTIKRNSNPAEPQSTLGDTYGKSAEDLAELMNAFRQRALGQ